MKRYTSSQVRERLAHVLDAAERGEEVIIERRGVRYSIRAERPISAGRRRKPLIDIVDPAVAAGEWTWTSKADGLTFSPKRRR
jgi:hypothetical protein